MREHKRNSELLEHSAQGDSDLDKLETALMLVARAKPTNFRDYYSDHFPTVNSLLTKNFTSCLESTTFDTSHDDLEDFLRHLIRVHYKSFIKCAGDLTKFLQDID